MTQKNEGTGADTEVVENRNLSGQDIIDNADAEGEEERTDIVRDDGTVPALNVTPTQRNNSPTGGQTNTTTDREVLTGVYSTNAIVPAVARILGNQETQTIESGIPVNIMGDINEICLKVLRTKNVKPGKIGPYMRSINFSGFSLDLPRGQRAGFIERDGTMTLMREGVKYEEFYQRSEGKLPIIVRFNQSADNPFVQVDYYVHSQMPALVNAQGVVKEDTGQAQVNALFGS